MNWSFFRIPRHVPMRQDAPNQLIGVTGRGETDEGFYTFMSDMLFPTTICTW